MTRINSRKVLIEKAPFWVNLFNGGFYEYSLVINGTSSDIENIGANDKYRKHLEEYGFYVSVGDGYNKGMFISKKNADKQKK